MKMSLSAPEVNQVRFPPARAPHPITDPSRWAKRKRDPYALPANGPCQHSASTPSITLPTLAFRLRNLIDCYIQRLERRVENRGTRFSDVERDVRVSALVARAIRDMSVIAAHVDPHDCEEEAEDECSLPLEPDVLREALQREIELLQQNSKIGK